LVAELVSGLARAEHAPDVSVIVIRHGGPVFCSGADLSEVTARGSRDAARTMVQSQRAGGSVPLLARMHPRAASAAFSGGRDFDGYEAHAYGLVLQAVPDEQFDRVVDQVRASPVLVIEGRPALSAQDSARFAQRRSGISRRARAS